MAALPGFIPLMPDATLHYRKHVEILIPEAMVYRDITPEPLCTPAVIGLLTGVAQHRLSTVVEVYAKLQGIWQGMQHNAGHNCAPLDCTPIEAVGEIGADALPERQTAALERIALWLANPAEFAGPAAPVHPTFAAAWGLLLGGAPPAVAPLGMDAVMQPALARAFRRRYGEECVALDRAFPVRPCPAYSLAATDLLHRFVCHLSAVAAAPLEWHDDVSRTRELEACFAAAAGRPQLPGWRDGLSGDALHETYARLSNHIYSTFGPAERKKNGRDEAPRPAVKAPRSALFEID